MPARDHGSVQVVRPSSRPRCRRELTLDCFELAVEVRRLDMAASPYDVSAYGLEAVRIETPDGKREYAARQREFAARGEVLRRRLLDGVPGDSRRRRDRQLLLAPADPDEMINS